MLSVKHLMVGIGHSIFNADQLDEPLLSSMESSEEESVDGSNTDLPTEIAGKPEYGTFSSDFTATETSTTDMDHIVAAVNPPELRVTASSGSTNTAIADAVTPDYSDDEIVPQVEDLEYTRRPSQSYQQYKRHRSESKPKLNRFSSLYSSKYDEHDGYESSAEWKEDGGIQEEGKVNK